MEVYCTEAAQRMGKWLKIQKNNKNQKWSITLRVVMKYLFRPLKTKKYEATILILPILTQSHK